jgi:glycosyltransferase involved in cell wall biosynthesis
MKKICFLVDSIFSFGGVQRVTAVIAKELSKDNDVTIVTFDKLETKDTSLYGLNEANLAYRFFQYPSTPAWKEKCCKAYSYLYRKVLPQTQQTSDLYMHSSFPSEKRDALAEELKTGNYDTIIGVHAPLAARLAACRKMLGPTKLIGWVHNSFEALFNPTSLYIGPELQRHYVYQFRKLDATIVLCKHDADTYRAYDPQLNTTVIYNPLTLTPGKQSEGTSKRFLAVGRFSRRHKGFDLLIEAFRIFAKENGEWTLDIVGEGVEEPIYRKMIKDYQLEERIHIHPFTNNIQKYYSEAQVYVLSSRWEGFGLVLVEAMAHGLPVISSDLPTSREIMGDFGIYFSNGDVNGLARRMAETTKIDWQAKSRQALEISHRFNIKTIADTWHKII